MVQGRCVYNDNIIATPPAWYSALPICSYNGIFSFVLGARNIGKTWAYKKRAYRRGVKKLKKTIWVRRFRNEAAECARTFFTSRDLQKFCGIEWYQKETDSGNVKQDGNTIYYRNKNKWEWIIKIIALSDCKKMRSSDDVDVDTIVYDEFTTTPEKYRLYRGDEVRDFIDLYISISRQHAVRAFFLGNKESVSNPYFLYFKLPVLPLKWQGIRHFKNGTITVQQVNDYISPADNHFKRLQTLLSDTDYGDYLYKATYKNMPQLKLKKAPTTASGYAQIDWKGRPLKIVSDANAVFYISSHIDRLLPIFTDKCRHKYKNEYQLVKSEHRDAFRALVQAVSDNRIYYESHADYESIQDFYAWLGLKN